MPSDRHRRIVSTQRVFLITGVDADERLTLGKNVQKLGAVYAKTEHFQNNATHVVCGKLSRSEKFLGALTLGRWVVRPQYVTASWEAGRWLDERDFEWSSLTTAGHQQILASAAKYNRWRVLTSGEQLFSGWNVAVVMRNSHRQAVYKRLLVFGGAKVMDLKLPVKNVGKCSEFLTYLFADSTMLPLTQSLQHHGVLCLRVDFISDAIVMHPLPEPLDYLLLPGTDDQTTYNALDDSSGTNGFTLATAPRPSSSTATRQAEMADDDDDDDDDMLVLTQCSKYKTPPPPPASTQSANKSDAVTATPRFAHKNNCDSSGSNNVRAAVMEVNVNTDDDFEEPRKGQRHPKAVEKRLTSEEMGSPGTSSDEDVVCLDTVPFVSGGEWIVGNSKQEQHGLAVAKKSVIICEDALSVSSDSGDATIITDSSDAEDFMTEIPRGNGGVKSLFQCPEGQKKEPLPKRQENEPLPKRQENEPLPFKQENKPLPKRQENEPLPNRQGDVTIITDSSDAEDFMTEIPRGNGGVKSLSQCPERQKKEPLPKRQEKEPLPKRQENEPLPKRQENEPLPFKQENKPLPKRQENEPLPKRQENEPLPLRQENKPLPKRQENEPLPKRQKKFLKGSPRKTRSEDHRQKASSLQRRFTMEGSLPRETLSKKKVQDLISHRTTRQEGAESRRRSATETEDEVRAAALGPEHVHHSPQTTGCNVGSLLSAACPSVGEGDWQRAASLELACAPGGLPCPVVVTAIKPPSVLVSSSLSLSATSTTVKLLSSSSSSSSTSTVVKLSLSLPSVSTAVTSSQPSSSTSAALKSPQSSSAAATSSVSSAGSFTPSKAGRRKRPPDSSITVTDVERELRKMKTDVTKGPFKQSLVFSSPRKIQTTLQNWFMPSGKENAKKQCTTADNAAKSERERLLGCNKAQLQTAHHHANDKTALQTLQKTLEVKGGIGKIVPKKVEGKSAASEAKSRKALPMHRKGIPCSVSDSSADQSILKSARGPYLSDKPHPASKIAVAGNPDAALPSVSPSDCSFDTNVLDTSQPDGRSGKNFSCESQSGHAPVVEGHALDYEGEVEGVKKPEDGCCGGNNVDGRSLGSEADICGNSVRKVGGSRTAPLVTDHASSQNSVAPCTLGHEEHSSVAAKVSLPNGRSGSVLSPRSVTKRRKPRSRYTTRERNSTPQMKSYLQHLRKRRKAEEPATSSTEHSSPCKSPVVAPVKRQKTVRGLSVRSELAPDVVLNGHPGMNAPVVKTELGTSLESDSVSASSVSLHQRTETNQNEAGNENKHTVANSLVTTDGRAKCVKSLNSSYRKRKLDTLDSASKLQRCSTPEVSVARWLLPSARWRLSHVSLPKQVDLTSCTGFKNVERPASRTHVSESLGLMISSSLDEKYFQSAVVMAHTAASSCPSVDLFRQMVQVVKEVKCPSLVSQANAILMSWLHQFPPITKDLLSIYEEALGLNNWENFRKTLEEAVTEAEADTTGTGCAAETHCGARMVLRIVLTALEKNFLHFAHSVSRQSRYKCLMVRCLWSPSYQVYPNGRTRNLMNFLERAVKYLNSPRACWSELLSMVNMATQCCYLADKGWQWSVDGSVDRCSGPMVQELAQAITGGSVESAGGLQHVLCSVAPPWLLRQVVASLMDDYDDYLVQGGLTSDPITLRTIVSKYFFLLPKLSAVDESENPSPREKVKTDPEVEVKTDPEVEVKTDPEVKEEQPSVPVNPKLTAEKINKRNPKGETKLHTAAIKNNISLLKQMLTVPGVDVNSQDYAGWTPLHEACNHGNVECVRAFLKFVPSVTLDSFFHGGAGGRKVRKVDLLSTDREGITPLHDAVISNHVGVVKLLLKYGGSSLLQARTILDYTPVDLAQTEEMRQLLARDPMDVSFSQESLSQEVGGEKREGVPSSFMYREVLDSTNNTHRTASLDELRKFLTLLKLLLRSHIQVLQQQQQQQQQQQPSPVRQEPSQQQQHRQLRNHQDGQLQSRQEALLPETEKCGAEDMKFYMQSFRRHVKKISSEDVLRCVGVQMSLLEALLTQCC